MPAGSHPGIPADKNSPALTGAGGGAGFSLLEVLVATTIMGLVLVVLLQVLMSTLRCRQTAANQTEAVLAAEKVLQENCELNRLTEGTYSGATGRYRYLVRVIPQFSAGAPLDGKQVLCSLIQVTVSWQEWGKARTLTLATARTGPGKGF